MATVRRSTALGTSTSARPTVLPQGAAIYTTRRISSAGTWRNRPNASVFRRWMRAISILRITKGAPAFRAAAIMASLGCCGSQARLASARRVTAHNSAHVLRGAVWSETASLQVEIGVSAAALIGDEPQLIALQAHGLAVWAEIGTAPVEIAAEIIAVPFPCPGHVAAKGAPFDLALGGDVERNAKARQVAILDQRYEPRAVGDVVEALCGRRAGKA